MPKIKLFLSHATHGSHDTIKRHPTTANS